MGTKFKLHLSLAIRCPRISDLHSCRKLFYCEERLNSVAWWLEHHLFLVEVHQLTQSLGLVKHRTGTEQTRTPPWQEETYLYQPYLVALKILWMNNDNVYCQNFLMLRAMTATKKTTKVALPFGVGQGMRFLLQRIDQQNRQILAALQQPERKMIQGKVNVPRAVSVSIYVYIYICYTYIISSSKFSLLLLLNRWITTVAIFLKSAGTVCSFEAQSPTDGICSINRNSLCKISYAIGL